MRALSQQGHGPGDIVVAGYKKEEPRIVVLLFCTVNSESVRQAAENGTDFVRARDCKQSSVLMYTIERQYSQTGRKVCRYTWLLPGDKGVNAGYNKKKILIIDSKRQARDHVYCLSVFPLKWERLIKKQYI